MKKTDVLIALERVDAAHRAWTQARIEFLSGSNAVMNLLVHEAAANYMSVDDIAKASGFTAKRVREMMRNAGLDPKNGKRLLSQKAAEALATNAALMGIEPGDMDLMSPLAYLPMGSKMKRELQDARTSQVTEVPEVSGNLLARVGAIIAEETSCGYCDGTCGACTETAQRIINVVQGS